MAYSHSWKAFERTCAKNTAEWWDGNPKHFRRLYLKAGWPWADGKGPDIVRILDPNVKEPTPDMIDHSFFLWLECKKRKAFNFYDLMSQEPSESSATEWFSETYRRAKEAKKHPMVFVRYPGSSRVLIMLENKLLKGISDLKKGKKGLRYIRTTAKPYERKKPILVGIVAAKEFFRIVTPDDMAKAYYAIRKKEKAS